MRKFVVEGGFKGLFLFVGVVEVLFCVCVDSRVCVWLEICVLN